jgi:hypothetical protein
LDEAHFLDACKRLNLPGAKDEPGESKLFRLLLSDELQRFVTLHGLKALLTDVPPDECEAVWGDEGNKGPASPREWIDKERGDFHAKNCGATSMARFRGLLIDRFGSLFGAWRKCLDFDQNGVVTQKDFVDACRHLGVRGGLTLWKEIDSNKNGQISLEELDKDTYRGMQELEKLLVDKYGDTLTGWIKGFDKENSVRVPMQRFVKRCKELGYSKDAERLFMLLIPECGCQHLVYEDIWFNTDLNGYADGGPDLAGFNSK